MVRLWVNGNLLIDQWHDNKISPTRPLLLFRGSIPIVMGIMKIMARLLRV